MTDQADLDAPAPEAAVLKAQASAASQALGQIEACLTALGANPNPDKVAEALAEPIRALTRAARES